MKDKKRGKRQRPSPCGTFRDGGKGASRLSGRLQAYLDAYFAGKAPSCAGIPLAPEGSAFQKRVWRRLLQIPYGETVTYGQIAGEIAKEKGGAHVRAGGGRRSRAKPYRDPDPCHRMVGAGGSLTGYAGGLDKKVFLLRLEGIRVEDSRII